MLKPVSLLLLPVFLILPIGIVEASDLDVQTNGTRVTINQDGGIRVESADSGTIVVPGHSAVTPVNPPLFDRYQPWWSQRSPSRSPSRSRITSVQCSGGGYSQQISQSSSSGTSMSRTYSSTSTCP